MISHLDDLKFVGGYPTAETTQKLYDQLDLQRAAQAYLGSMSFRVERDRFISGSVEKRVGCLGSFGRAGGSS